MILLDEGGRGLASRCYQVLPARCNRSEALLDKSGRGFNPSFCPFSPVLSILR